VSFDNAMSSEERQAIAAEIDSILALPEIEPGEITILDFKQTLESKGESVSYSKAAGKLKRGEELGMLSSRLVWAEGRKTRVYRQPNENV